MLAGLFGLSGGFFALFTAAVVLLAGWEWTNLAGIRQRDNRLMLVGVLAMAMLMLWLSGGALMAWPLWLGVAGWLVNLTWVTRYPEGVDQWRAPARRLLMGLWVLLPAWVGLNVLRDSGAVWLLFVLLHPEPHQQDRKSTRLNSSHVRISYAVFCLKKKKKL